MASPRVVLAGADALGLATAERLVAAGADVTLLCMPAEAASVGHEIERIGARLVVGSAHLVGELTAAGVENADAVLLTTDDDALNVDAALTAARLRPGLPIVARVFDRALGDYLRTTAPSVVVLSMSAIAAPVFATLAVDALRTSRSLAASARRWRRPRRLSVDRVLATLSVTMLVSVVGATVFFAHVLGLRAIDAFYFVSTTIATVGYGDIALKDAPDVAKLAGIVLMFAGAGFLAVVYALVSGAVVARRLDVLRGRVPVRGRDHVVIAGAGNVGIRVARLLAAEGRRIVVIERDGDGRNVSDLRAAGAHVIVADAGAGDTLELAGASHAGAVLALTDSDAVNVHIALRLNESAPDVPVVLRLLSPELARHVAGHGARVASPVALAANEFSHAALAACENAARSHPRTVAGGM